MTEESKDEKLALLEDENEQLRQELERQRRLATRSLAGYQQRALQMEIIRQQNEDLDRLAVDLASAKGLAEKKAREVQEAARLKGEFLANFSHEIRTPLNGIIGYCDLLASEEGERLTAHGRRDLTTIRKNAKTLLALINDILDLSKIESGQLDVVKERVDFASLVDDCIATVQELLKGKDVEVRIDLDEASQTLFTDGLKLRQILLNLLSNAAKFTDLGEIRVCGKAKDNGLTLSVEDTGEGIPQGQLPHIFEKFRQVDGSSTRTKGGTGLGLAIVKELCRVLGGDISVESTLGRGTVFRVELEGVVEAGDVQKSLRPEPASDRPKLADLDVLVVDDDPMVQQLIRSALEAEKVNVRVVADGMAALSEIRERVPDVVVLDLRLPRLDGWSVLSTIKDSVETRSIPVVLMSVEEERARGFALGAFEYLVKPVESERLVSTIGSAVTPGSGSILVVDDNPDIRSMVERGLQAAGFTVSTAANGDEALLRIRAEPPALMVLDLIMPQMDGFEVLDRVRKAGHEFPVVVLTGKELTQADRGALREGFARVIRKNGRTLEDVVDEAKRFVMNRRALRFAQLPRVLYVEDVSQNRDIVRRYLNGVAQVLEAHDGEHGVQMAKQERPDLILMDLSLPRLDGWAATSQLKQLPELAAIPVVALTAHASKEDRERAEEAGCCDYLTKPIERGPLVRSIRKQLRARA